MRWLAVALVVLLLGVGFVAYMRPDLFPTGDIDLPRLIYLVMALLLVSGAAFGFRRIRADRGRVVQAILFWTALILVIVALYPLVN